MSNDFTLRYGSWAMVAGASEGLGAAFAEALAKRGLNLILLARRIEKLEDLASSLKKYNIEIRFPLIYMISIRRKLLFLL